MSGVVRVALAIANPSVVAGIADEYAIHVLADLRKLTHPGNDLRFNRRAGLLAVQGLE